MDVAIPIRLSPDDIEAIADAVALRLRSSTLTPADAQQLYREPDVARTLGIALHTLRRLRQTGEITASVTRRPVRYTLEDIEAARRVMQGQAGMSSGDGGSSSNRLSSISKPSRN